MTASTTAGAALFTNLNDNGRPGAGSTPIQPTGKTYLALPKNKPLVRNHCLIAPLNHVSSCAQMDEDVLDEIKIPAGFSYFVVYFGLEGGMAHIIENESLVPSWFGQEVIGGMLGLEYNQWRKPANEVLEQQVKRVTTFKKQLKEFDSTIFQK
ncbi:conserved hypothetical protein [Trichinella spiralis]|uniref:hypothetical protein n=1 Tax=Trichinella spiralis TaxID=6334 RepID=UPI0001EFB5CA|nr:conserved hypothetical protein [Trichinella spiralis]